MTEKIIVIPREVRGLGNIVDKKELDDYDTFESSITESTDTVLGKEMTIYTMVAAGYHLTLSLSSTSITYGTTVTCTATLTDMGGEGVSGASVKFYDGTTLLDTKTTNSSGVATYTTSSSLGIGSHTLKASYDDTIKSNTVSLTVNKLSTSITISASSNNIHVGDTPSMSGTLSVGSGKSLKIYKNGGSTVYATVTTSTDGAWSFTDSATTSEGNITYYAVYEGDDTHTSVTSTTITIGVTKTTTNLTITPPTLVYQDNFSVTGVLKDSSDNGVVGETITLHWEVGGVEQTATATTVSGGAVTFSRTAPTTITTYKFWLSYSGSPVYGSSTSSECNVTVAKETTILALSSPLDNSNYAPSDTVNILGSLKTDDDELLVGESVVMKLNGTTIDTFTTDEDGEFYTLLSGSALSAGSNTLSFEYSGDANYNGSTISRTLIQLSYSLTLDEHDDKTVLSYADSDTAILEATLKYGGVAVENAPILFDDGSSTMILENQTIGSTPYQTTTTVGDAWKLVATGDAYTMIDVYESGTSSYIRISFPNNQIKLASGRNEATITGTTLYHCAGVFYTDTGDMVNTRSWNYNPISYSVLKFAVYTTITSWESIGHVAVTDSNGVASYTYNSQGVGDISFTANYGTLVSETYSIIDALRYDPTEYSSVQTPNWSLPSGNFAISFEFKPTSRTSCYPQMGIGTDTNNLIYMGQTYTDGRCGYSIRKNGSTVTSASTNATSTLNTYQKFEYSYVSGTHTFKALGETLTSSNSDTTLSKVVQLYNSNSSIKNILIKPL